MSFLSLMNEMLLVLFSRIRCLTDVDRLINVVEDHLSKRTDPNRVARDCKFVEDCLILQESKMDEVRAAAAEESDHIEISAVSEGCDEVTSFMEPIEQAEDFSVLSESDKNQRIKDLQSKANKLVNKVCVTELTFCRHVRTVLFFIE